jgi:hypothetical protein
MAMSWGPLTHPVHRFADHATGEEGDVVRHSPSGEGAPTHPVDYNATDGRHNRESGLAPWTSVDSMSGPVSDTDFGTPAGRFPDGPGAWRQT